MEVMKASEEVYVVMVNSMDRHKLDVIADNEGERVKTVMHRILFGGITEKHRKVVSLNEPKNGDP